MNKEELTTLPTLQGTSHCSCLEHCFLFAVETGAAEIPGKILGLRLRNVEHEDETASRPLHIHVWREVPAAAVYSVQAAWRSGHGPMVRPRDQHWAVWSRA